MKLAQLVKVGEDDASIPGSDASQAGSTPEWVKVGDALSYTTFRTAATTKTNTLFSLPAGGIVHEVKMKASTAFAGTSISALTFSVGIAGTHDKYASAFDGLAAVAATTFELSDALGAESHTAATNITISADATGANLSALSAGVLDVWALISIAK